MSSQWKSGLLRIISTTLSPASTPRPRKAAAAFATWSRVVVERPLLPATGVVHAAQRDGVAVGGDGLQEHAGHGLTRDCPIDLFDAGPGHGVPSWSPTVGPKSLTPRVGNVRVG